MYTSFMLSSYFVFCCYTCEVNVILLSCLVRISCFVVIPVKLMFQMEKSYHEIKVYIVKCL